MGRKPFEVRRGFAVLALVFIISLGCTAQDSVPSLPETDLATRLDDLSPHEGEVAVNNKTDAPLDEIPEENGPLDHETSAEDAFDHIDVKETEESLVKIRAGPFSLKEDVSAEVLEDPEPRHIMKTGAYSMGDDTDTLNPVHPTGNIEEEFGE